MFYVILIFYIRVCEYYGICSCNYMSTHVNMWENVCVLGHNQKKASHVTATSLDQPTISKYLYSEITIAYNCPELATNQKIEFLSKSENRISCCWVSSEKGFS